MKSKSDLFDELVESVRAIHTYQVPEIIAVPVQLGSNQYLGWIDEVLIKRDRNR